MNLPRPRALLFALGIVVTAGVFIAAMTALNAFVRGSGADSAHVSPSPSPNATAAAEGANPCTVAETLLEELSSSSTTTDFTAALTDRGREALAVIDRDKTLGLDLVAIASLPAVDDSTAWCEAHTDQGPWLIGLSRTGTIWEVDDIQTAPTTPNDSNSTQS